MSESEPKYLVIGEVLKPWGYQGQIKVKILTDFPKRLTSLETVYVGEKARAVQVERARLHSGYALFKLKGYDTELSASKLRGEIIRIPIEEAAPLPKGQYYHHQIVGLNVFTAKDEESLGRVEQILETGANDVYLVRRPDGRELLLPATANVVKQIDLDRGSILVDLLPGLE